MVDSGTVNGDKGNITQKLSTYISQVTGLEGTWKGTSHDKLVTQANSFKDEYSSALESGLTSFATACDKYKEYEKLRNEIKDIESQISSAAEGTDTSGLERDKKTRVDQCEALRGEITSALSSASSPKLEATKMASSISPSTGSNTTTTSAVSGATTSSQYAIAPHSTMTDDGRGERLALVGGECGSEAEQDAKMTTISVPYWDGSSQQTMNLTVNKNLTSNFTNAFQKLADMHYTVLPECTGAYDYNHTPRPSGAPSDHTLGSVVDINWDHNWDTGDGSEYSVRGNEDVINAFASEGFYWGGDWSHADDMHFTFTGY